MIFVVCKQAIYLHDVYGPFDKAVDAVARAGELARSDCDAHHEWVVRSVDPVLGLSKSVIHTTCKPNCPYCGAEPPRGAYWEDGIAEECPCGMKASPE